MTNIEKAVWTTAYINDLPDSSFAFIEAGGKKDEESKTTPRSLRHLPYKNKEGRDDPAHIRNGLARLNSTHISDAAKATARAKLIAAAKRVGIAVAQKAYCAKCGVEKEEMMDVREELMPDKRMALVGHCIDCGTQMVKAQGRGRMGGDKPGSGPGGNCICPKCGTKIPHETADPCNTHKCPKCGTTMTKE